MQNLLIFFLVIPLLSFLGGLFIKKEREAHISNLVFSSLVLYLIFTLVFISAWIAAGAPVLHHRDLVLFRSGDYEFFLDFYFDSVTAVFLVVGALLSAMVAKYSRVYLHRESGYKRFFNTIQFFFLGYAIVVIAGNLETMFIGWEVLGISSFLLIAFYRDRYLPVKNALKVFSIYRVADIGLILAMWMSHQLWHSNVTFADLNNYVLVHQHLQEHSLIGVFISLMILVSAAAKSAQLPFSSWLPRAMEGPTPSSAIFYGSLSVHIGVFVLLRTYAFWEHQISVRIIIGLLGITTALVATGIARVQSSVKSQIAYASIAQIGIIFLEIAAGLQVLALIHFAGNAFLRTYQLLISPSVVSYLIKEQFFHFSPHKKSIEESWSKRVQYSFYMLCLKEWNLDTLMSKFLWQPSKWLGRRLDFLNLKRILLLFVPLYAMGVVVLLIDVRVQSSVRQWIPEVFSIIGLIMVLKAFTERRSVRMAWLMVMMNHLWLVLAVMFNEHFDFSHALLYLTGVLVAGFIGLALFTHLQRKEPSLDLNRFHGFARGHKMLALATLLACLGLSGFPITPTFIGEDLIFSHIGHNQILLAFTASMSFVLDGLAIMRIYARVFMGPHSKEVYEMGYRSS